MGGRAQIAWERAQWGCPQAAERWVEVPATGLEPATPVLQVRCATNCAKPARTASLSRRGALPEAAQPAVVGVGVGVGVAVE